MKHTVEVKLPKLFGGKKKIDNEPEVVTEIDLNDKNKSVPLAVVVAAPLLIGISIGYLVGFKAGVGRGGTNVVVVKD